MESLIDGLRKVAAMDRSRLVGVAFGVATQLLFAATVWQLFWFLRDGGTRESPHWLVLDLLLSGHFAVLHSVLLLPRVRSWITHRLPGALYGCLFNVATCASLWLIFGYWRTAHSSVWHLNGPAAMAVRFGFYGSWIALFASLRLSGFGYQTGWTQWLYWVRRQPSPRRGLVERGAFRWLRHPVYLSFLGLIWFTPLMTFDHAALTSVWTVYVFVGSRLKDQRLAYYLGNTYREYASRVPGYPGMFFAGLGKWSLPSGDGGDGAQVVRRAA